MNPIFIGTSKGIIRLNAINFIEHDAELNIVRIHLSRNLKIYLEGEEAEKFLEFFRSRGHLRDETNEEDSKEVRLYWRMNVT